MSVVCRAPRQGYRRFSLKHGSDSRWPRAAASGRRAAPRPVGRQGGGSVMQVEETAIPAVKIVTPKKHGDARGFFSEVYNRSDWDKAGLEFTFVQDNHSFSAAVGTLRGTALPDAAVRARQTGACHARPHSRRRGRHSPLVADLRPVCRGRALGRQTGASCWSRSGLRTLSSLWSPTSRFSTRRPRPIRPPMTEASPGTIRRSALPGRRSPGGPVLSDKDRRLPRLKDAPELFE